MSSLPTTPVAIERPLLTTESLQLLTATPTADEKHSAKESEVDENIPNDKDSLKHVRLRQRKFKKRKSLPTDSLTPGTGWSLSDDEVNIPHPSRQIVSVTMPSSGDEQTDDENNPARTEHFVCSNQRQPFCVVSQAMQTDWSWLRDKQKVCESQQPEQDIEEVLDKLRFGLYGGMKFKSVELMMPKKKGDRTSELNESEKDTSDSRSTADTGDDIGTSPSNLQVSISETAIPPASHKSAHKKNSGPSSCKKSRMKSVASIQNSKSDQSSRDEDETEDLARREKPGKKTLPNILKYTREKSALKSKKLANVLNKVKSAQDGLFSGACQFCGKPVTELKGQPTNRNLMDQLFCCPEYEQFLSLHLDDSLVDDPQNKEEEIINVIQNQPASSALKTPRKAMVRGNIVPALERGKKPNEKLKAMMAVQQQNFFSVSRQMKTIQYSLASTRCMDEGWTVVPKDDLPPLQDTCCESFHVGANATPFQKRKILNEKFYEDGTRFLTMFPDGTGAYYYPNGLPAIIITPAGKNMFTYFLLKEEKFTDARGVLAIFEPNGNTVCYHKCGTLRLFTNLHGGIEFTCGGLRRKRWRWQTARTKHSKAPPFQPLLIQLNDYILVRIMDQDIIMIQFSANRRSTKFNIGCNIKPLDANVVRRFVPHPAEVELHEAKRKTIAVLVKIHKALRLPRSIRPEIPVGNEDVDVTTQEDHGTQEANLPPIENENNDMVNMAVESS